MCIRDRVNAPAARIDHTAVWTSSEMLVWGGSVFNGTDYSNAVATGGRYDPVSDTWSSMAVAGAPGPRSVHTAVWTGTRMLVWGGFHNQQQLFLGDGGRYDPSTDTWSPISMVQAPGPVSYTHLRA